MTIKRFVAGAVCPRCSAMDRLRTWRDAEREYRECIDCGYEDAMRLDGTQPAEELATRVNRRPTATTATTATTAEEQVLTFVPNPAVKKT